MSQTDTIFSQTSDQPIISVSKVGRAAATDLSWLSMYSYKKDRAQRGPLKAFWLRAQWDKNTNCSVCQWFSSSIPSLYTAALRILSWGGLLSGVDGGQNVFRHASCGCFLISSIFIFCLSHLPSGCCGVGLR